MLAQQLVNGVVSGAIFVLFALGFNLVFSTLNIMNFAHGAVFMAGAFVGVIAVSLGLPFWVAMLLAMIGSGLLSVAVEIVVFRPLRRHNGGEFAAIVAGLGVNLVLLNAAQILSKTQVFRFPPGVVPTVIVTMAGLRISFLQIVIIGLVVALVALLWLYLYRTSMGRQIRAVALNPRAATLLGVNASAAYVQTFFLSGMFAGASGVLIGIVFNSVHFMMGEPYMLRAFVVLVIGGLGSLTGAVVAGLALGIIQTLTAVYLPPALGEIVVFSLLFVVLVIRPSGILGSKLQNSRVARV
jgi:branched-chain amino acid transport system permease protein